MAQIDKPGLHFNTKLYSGNGSTKAQTGVGFQPDLFWCKSRSNAENHTLIDAVRGVGYGLGSNTTAAQYGSTNFGSFDSDGFTWSGNLGSGNENGQTYVSWNWKAGGAGSANTDGDINSTVSVNQTAGFSIVKYTGTDVAGATVGHGLNAVPKMIILKRLVGSGYDWVVYHKDKTAGLYLNSAGYNNDSSSNNIWFNGAAPTSSVFSIGTDGRIGDATDFIAYCFAEKTGYSKFGKYTATGSTSVTPFIYTGFKPQFVMTKNITGSDAWTMSDIPRDNAVGGGNGTGSRLRADNAAGEDTNTSWASIQKYSNGFSPQGNDHVTNGSGQSYIYMAFGQSIVGSNNIPATAR